MIYLGIHDCFESGVALVVDGEIKAAVQEERFTREKNYAGFPSRALGWLLEEFSLRPQDVDRLVYPMFDDILPDRDRWKRLVRRALDGAAKTPGLAQKFAERIESEIDFNANAWPRFAAACKAHGFDKQPLRQDHHRSHAAGAAFCSPFDDCLVFTCDGKGGFRSTAVWRASGTLLELLDYGTTFDSAGYFYANVTKALGFRHERHEGKITGLAAYGNPTPFLPVTDNILSFNHGRICATLGPHYLPWFAEREVLPDFYAEVERHPREDVAAAAQATLERVVCQWVKHWVQHCSGGKPLSVALSGGVFANVKLNQHVRELDCVDRVFVSPAMTDGGLPLGGALAQMASDGQMLNAPLVSVALGPEWHREQVAAQLRARGRLFSEPDSIADTLIRFFSAGEPVGMFHGKLEYGPRALCNRSILFHCRDHSVNDWLNRRLNRTEFMPFAPVTTAEMAPRCFRGWHPDDPASDFMTMTYRCTAEFEVACPAAVHVDGTARPQIVRRQVNPYLHRTLTDYFARTGELALINTSFNNHEEPIVCSVDDALRSLDIGNVKALLIEGLLVTV